jgi:WD40 repeat protein
MITWAASFAAACVFASRSGHADEIGSELGLLPDIFVSDRMVLRSANPPRPVINESVAFAPDGKTLATSFVEASHDSSGKPLAMVTVVSIWSTTDLSPRRRIELVSDEGCSVAYSPDGLTLAIGLAAEIKLYDAPTGRERATLTANGTGYVESLAFSADGRRLATASLDSVVVWDLFSNRVVATISTGPGFVHGVAFGRDGKTIAAAAELPLVGESGKPLGLRSLPTITAGGQVGVWDLERRTEVQSFEYRQAAYAVAFSPDGRRLATVGGAGARLCDLDGADRLTIAVTPVYCLAYSPDGRYLAMGAEDEGQASASGEVRLWDTEAGRDRAVLRGSMTRVYAVAFAPDGRTLAAASPEGVFLWDLTGPFQEQDEIVTGSAGTPGAGDSVGARRSERSQTSKSTRRSPDDRFWLVVVGMSFILVPVIGFIGLSASLALFEARAECRAFLKIWIEAEGLKLRTSREFLFPVIVRLGVEDGHGFEFGGWALIMGKFASVTRENVTHVTPGNPAHITSGNVGHTSSLFVPRKVRYLLLWRVERPLKPSKPQATVALWDDWLDRQSEA